MSITIYAVIATPEIPMSDPSWPESEDIRAYSLHWSPVTARWDQLSIQRTYQGDDPYPAHIVAYQDGAYRSMTPDEVEVAAAASMQYGI